MAFAFVAVFSHPFASFLHTDLHTGNFNSSDPTRAILDRYDIAKDKHVFVAWLVGTLLLRHRQWQAAAEAKVPSICSAITPCQHVSSSNSAYPEDKSAKLGQSRMR
ncbi:MAG: hypothetical protein K6G15_00030 [Desulfovibrio sp.]|nr:hypothetical protein [Desulfovibrio sp.]